MGSPFIIGVGGASSSAGKTTIAAALIRELSLGCDNFFNKANGLSLPLKYSFSTKKRWGAIKYTGTDFYTSIIDDLETLNMPDKDTQRFIEAGAQEVLWVQSPPENLHEVMPLALDKLYHLDGIVIEGNSAVEFVKPDVIVFVSAGGSGEIKQSAWKLIGKADIVIISADSPLTAYTDNINKGSVVKICDFLNSGSKDIIKEVILYMDRLAAEKAAAELILKRSNGNAISCSEARTIAEETGLPYFVIGKLADELKVKIRNCELGCF